MQDAPDCLNKKAALTRWIERLELASAVLLSAVTLFLFVIRATHAGSLWRDEADSVQSAQLPLVQMFHAVQFSSFPIAFPLVVRGYTALVGASDTSLRCFGFAVGIAVLALAWFPIRKRIGGFPLLLLAMIGLNVNFLTAGLSLRGYGLGSALMLTCLIFTVRFLLRPRTATFVAMCSADFVSMHCLFWNVPLVLALTIGAACVLLFRAQKRWAVLSSAFLIVAGFSEVPYLLQFHSSVAGWERIIQVPVSFRSVWQHFFIAWGNISPGVSMMWLVVLLLAVTGGLSAIPDFERGEITARKDLAYLAIVLIPFSIFGSCAFAMFIQRSMEQRFFLSLTVLAAASADLLWVNFPRWLRAARIVVVVGTTVMLPALMWEQLIQSESNAETTARILERQTAARDLIVVNPWTYAVSFNWYYHGAAPWVSVPRIEDHRIHRYDLVLRKMETPSPLADLEGDIANTLQSGNRVWFAGQLEIPAPGENSVQVAPAPDSKIGWNGAFYRKAWSQQIGLFLWQHVRKGTPIDIETGGRINSREKFILFELEGWKE